MRQNSFWSACEEIPGATAVEAEWRIKAGSGYETAKAFLKPRQELACCYPCTSRPPCTCHHRVVDHGGGSIVAVCVCEGQGCRNEQLTKTDLVIYELNTRKLCDAIGQALSLAVISAVITQGVVDFSPIINTTHVGYDQPTMGYSFPVYLTVQNDSDAFYSVVTTLVATNETPFVLVTPTPDWITPGIRSLVALRKSLLLTVPDVLLFSETGLVIASPAVQMMLERFHTGALPSASEQSSMRFFLTPAGSSWADVKISFIYGDKVAIKVKHITGTFNWGEMGMSNKKNGDPTAQWELLTAFARGHGTLDWTSSNAHLNNQKRKEILAKNLQAFFRIEGDPFTYDKQIKGWETKFAIEPD